MSQETEADKRVGFVVRYELLGIIALMIMQSLGAAWWASAMATNMINVKGELVEIKQQLSTAAVNSYRIADAARDFGVVNTRLEKLEVRTTDLEKGSRITLNPGGNR